MRPDLREASILALRRKLRELDTQRASIEAKIAALSTAPPRETVSQLLPDEKVAPFRRLFAGRPGQFALRVDRRSFHR